MEASTSNWTRIGAMNRHDVAQPSRLRVPAASRRVDVRRTRRRDAYATATVHGELQPPTSDAHRCHEPIFAAEAKAPEDWRSPDLAEAGSTWPSLASWSAAALCRFRMNGSWRESFHG